MSAWGNIRSKLLQPGTQKYLQHVKALIVEQLAAVVPISIWLIVSIAAFFQTSITDAGSMVAGLISAIIGLVMFLEGLRVAIMPCGELLGRRLPLKLPLPSVLCVAFCLGVLVTYAEPAIASLRPLALLVDRTRAPYLSYMLNELQEGLVFAIALGVGIAAVLGTLRFAKGWSLKPLIFITVAPTLAASAYLQWTGEELRPLLSLFWDTGAITTGPVTVPILISLGIGVSAGLKERGKRAKVQNEAANEQEMTSFSRSDSASSSSSFSSSSSPSSSSSSSPLPPSTTPTSFCNDNEKQEQKPQEQLQNVDSSDEMAPSSPVASSPPPAVRRSVSFENSSAARVSIQNFAASMNESASGSATPTSANSNKPDALEGFGIVTLASLWPVFTTQILGIIVSLTKSRDDIINSKFDTTVDSAAERTPVREIIFAIRSILPLAMFLLLCIHFLLKEPIPRVSFDLDFSVKSEEEKEEGKSHLEEVPSVDFEKANKSGIIDIDITQIEPNAAADTTPPTLDAAALAIQHPVVIPIDEESKACVQQENGGQDSVSIDAITVEPPPVGLIRRIFKSIHSAGSKHFALVCGLLLAQVGMMLFNIGLTYGFTSLGDQAGTLLPGAYLHITELSSSPRFSYEGGIAIVFFVVFGLGVLATRAEPALNVLGNTVEKLTDGQFKKSLLIAAVCIGVGLGMAVGSVKILFQVGVIYIILAKYAVALFLTVFSSESFINIAWDSAGVTTGPVTVPFVLSIGIGFSKAVDAAEGFGILTAASVGPIITVLFANFSRNGVKHIKNHLERRSIDRARKSMDASPRSLSR